MKLLSQMIAVLLIPGLATDPALALFYTHVPRQRFSPITAIYTLQAVAVPDRETAGSFTRRGTAGQYREQTGSLPTGNRRHFFIAAGALLAGAGATAQPSVHIPSNLSAVEMAEAERVARDLQEFVDEVMGQMQSPTRVSGEDPYTEQMTQIEKALPEMWLLPARLIGPRVAVVSYDVGRDERGRPDIQKGFSGNYEALRWLLDRVREDPLARGVLISILVGAGAKLLDMERRPPFYVETFDMAAAFQQFGPDIGRLNMLRLASNKIEQEEVGDRATRDSMWWHDVNRERLETSDLGSGRSPLGFIFRRYETMMNDPALDPDDSGQRLHRHRLFYHDLTVSDGALFSALRKAGVPPEEEVLDDSGKIRENAALDFLTIPPPAQPLPKLSPPPTPKKSPTAGKQSPPKSPNMGILFLVSGLILVALVGVLFWLRRRRGRDPGRGGPGGGSPAGDPGGVGRATTSAEDHEETRPFLRPSPGHEPEFSPDHPFEEFGERGSA